MNTNQPSDGTLAYYDRNAREFVEETVGLPMGPLYGPFLALVPAGGHILDAGCGSGRDAREFKRRGYRVTAIEGSRELARLAAEVIGQPVEVLRFQDLDYGERFDGIWACASLLHVLRAQMDQVFEKFIRSLRPGGVWYLSFKLGEAEEVRGGRLFNDYTEQSLGGLVSRHPALRAVRVWRTEDIRPGRSGEYWLNALLQKAGQA
jgi:SAM-dependent methyltransferase